eukprot:365242-Chlamydomonas_euryale.AAC.3
MRDRAVGPQQGSLALCSGNLKGKALIGKQPKTCVPTSLYPTLCLHAQEVGRHHDVIAVAEPLLLAAPESTLSADVATSLALAYFDRSTSALAGGHVRDSCADLEAAVLLLRRWGHVQRRLGCFAGSHACSDGLCRICWLKDSVGGCGSDGPEGVCCSD